MKRLPLTLLIALCSISLMLGCAATGKNSYKVLVVSKTTYDTALSTAGDLYKQGKITEEQKESIIISANAYKEAHNVAVAALLSYQSSGEMEDEEAYLRAVSTASLMLAEMLKVVSPFIGGDQ